jgi:hypothetical protein
VGSIDAGGEACSISGAMPHMFSSMDVPAARTQVAVRIRDEAVAIDYIAIYTSP